MNKIYLWCEPTGTGLGIVNGSTVGGDVIGCAISEDGRFLASHISSNEDFSKHDMGLTSNWKHERYIEYYPNGFELEWIEDTKTHEGWKKAYVLNQVVKK